MFNLFPLSNLLSTLGPGIKRLFSSAPALSDREDSQVGVPSIRGWAGKYTDVAAKPPCQKQKLVDREGFELIQSRQLQRRVNGHPGLGLATDLNLQ
jgi:hypothetical protein